MVKLVYFSGTGNSLAVAKQLFNTLADCELFPLVRLLNTPSPRIEADQLVVIYPTYLMTLPYPVRQFFHRADLGSVRYLAAVTTSERGNNLSQLTIGRILKHKGKRLDYFAEVPMPQNTPTGIRPTRGDQNWALHISKANTDLVLERSRARCVAIAKDLAGGVVHRPEEAPLRRRLLERVISQLSKDNSTRLDFFHDDTCTGCRTCEKICPAKRITVTGKTVAWNQGLKCFYCFGCFNACPEQAILLKNYSCKGGRYINPDVSIAELVAQNS